jgi:hypothetical protein
MPEFNRPLGTPLGPPLKVGHEYTRSFEHVDVWVNVETKQASLVWADDADQDELADEWELAHFGSVFTQTGSDLATLDSDLDGDLDILEIFQGTDRTDPGDNYGIRVAGADASSQQITARYLRSTTQAAVSAICKWSCHLTDWHLTGESADGVTVVITESVAANGPGYEIVEATGAVVLGNPERLFIRLEAAPIQ